MSSVNLNNNAVFQQYFQNLNGEQTEVDFDEMRENLSEDELQVLDSSNPNTGAAKTTSTQSSSKKTANDVSSWASKIQSMYSSSGADPQTQILNFGKALDAGVIQQLSDEGFDKMQIVDVISGAFPNIGIQNNGNGTYDCPKGHEFSSIYDKFVSQMANLDSAELKEAKTKLANLNHEILSNNRKLKNLEYNITTLQEKIEERINDAIEESEEITQEQKEEAKMLVARRLNEYTNSNGKMTYSEFSEGLASDLDFLAGSSNSKLSQTVRKITDAQSEMSTLNGYLKSMGNIVASNEKLSKEAMDVQNQIADLKQQAATCSDAQDRACKRTDPTGFADGETRYDFFVDEDNDGNVTNENEFLGAKNGFQEMLDADVDKDGKVDANELDKKNVKVVVTNADGSQEVKNASEVLKEGDSIDLSSYQAQNTEMSNGNTLQGTFNVNKDGQTLDGYQTLDSLDWLDENYEFSDEIAGTGRFAQEQTEAVEAEDYGEKYNIFMDKYSQLEDLEVKALQTLGVDAQQVQDGISNMSNSEGRQKASVIEKGFKMQEAKEEAEAKAEKKKEEELKHQEEEKAKAKAEEEAKARKKKKIKIN